MPILDLSGYRRGSAINQDQRQTGLGDIFWAEVDKLYMRLAVLKSRTVLLFLICLVAVAAFAWYESLPRPHNPSPTTTSVEYILTKNGNHTQIQSIYGDGGGAIEQLNWLNFDNRTAVYNYFGCTPHQQACTVDGCPFTVLNDNATEYRVKVVCPPGA